MDIFDILILRKLGASPTSITQNETVVAQARAMSDEDKKKLLTQPIQKGENSYSFSAVGVPSVSIEQVFPLRMKRESDTEWFDFPIEPIISIAGRNVIVRRNVAKGKGRGSVKEFWTQDDYAVEIKGIFLSADNGEYPEELMAKWLELCESGESIEVECDLFRIYNITRLVIEAFEAPFTKGSNLQQWAMKCYSDDSYDFLVEDPNYVIQ